MVDTMAIIEIDKDEQALMRRFLAALHRLPQLHQSPNPRAWILALKG